MNQPHHTRSLWGSTIFLILSLLVVYVGAVYLLTWLLGLLPGFEMESGLRHFLIYVGSFALTIAYGLVLQRQWGFQVPRIPTHERPGVRLTVGGVILILAASIVLNPLLGLLPERYMEPLESYMQGGFWPMLTSVIAAPVLEEFLFRGIIQKNLQSRFGPGWGIVLGAVIFGLVHGIPQQIIYATVLGAIMGSVYYLTGSLLSVIAIHFVNNGFTALLYIFFGDSSQIEQEVLGDGTLWWTVYGICAALLAGWGWYVVRAVRNSSKK